MSKTNKVVTLVAIFILAIVFIVLISFVIAIVHWWSHHSQIEGLELDEKTTNNLTQEASDVAQTFNLSLQGGTVLDSSCQDNEFNPRTCNYTILISAGNITTTALKSKITSNGWQKDTRPDYDKYFVNTSYKYCGSLLKVIALTDNYPALQIHCFSLE